MEEGVREHDPTWEQKKNSSFFSFISTTQCNVYSSSDKKFLLLRILLTPEQTSPSLKNQIPAR